MTLTLIPGKPHPVTSEAETLSIIRDVAGNLDQPPLEVRPKRVVTHPARPLAQRPKALKFAPLEAPEEFEEPATEEATPKAKRAWRFKNPVKRWHVAIVLSVVTLVVAPKLVLFTALFALLMLVMVFYIAGAEQIWRGVVLALHDLAETDPRRAARIRMRLDRVADRWDRILDRFPAGSVDALYMPDFQALSLDEARNEARLNERLERLREGC